MSSTGPTKPEKASIPTQEAKKESMEESKKAEEFGKTESTPTETNGKSLSFSLPSIH